MTLITIAQKDSISQAANLLSQGQVVAFPTETVYGLGANALDPIAIQRIYQAKGRPSDNPLIVHISSLEMLMDLLPQNVPLPSIYAQLCSKLWPGPLTILVPRSPKIPLSVTGGHDTVAIRMPAHPIARALIQACGFPLAAPSANTSGRPSPTTAFHVQNDLEGRIPLILDGGPCDCGIESTVLDGLASPPVILRPGGITFETLRSFPGMHALRVYKKGQEDLKGIEEAPTTPGMKYRHYTPDAQVILIEACASKEEQRFLASRELASFSLGKKGLLSTGSVFVPSKTFAFDAVVHLGDSPAEIARNLFGGLRALEDMDVIFVEGILDQGEGLGIMNRLRKAASHVISP